MTFKITLESEKYPMTGDEREIELSPEQEVWIVKELAEGRTVPLYATTKAKAKYGDCKIGNIIKVDKLQ